MLSLAFDFRPVVSEGGLGRGRTFLTLLWPCNPRERIRVDFPKLFTEALAPLVDVIAIGEMILHRIADGLQVAHLLEALDRCLAAAD